MCCIEVLKLICSICALVISVAAMLYTNKPYVTFELVDTPKNRVAIKIKNDGTGTAIIKKIILINRMTEKECVVKNGKEIIEKMSEEFGENAKIFSSQQLWKRFDNIDSIAPHDYVYLLEMDPEAGADIKDIESFRQIFSKYTLMAIYGKSLFAKSKTKAPLQYFARKLKDKDSK